MLAPLGLGFLIGMQHALEADHLAAVSSLAAGQSSPKRILHHGLLWGLGHALILFGLAGVVLFLGTQLDGLFARALECAVGFMLIGLGLQVFWRLHKARVHFHVHEHGAGKKHFHAHAHGPQTNGTQANGTHSSKSHAHVHPQGLPWRSLLVGMMHGMAGSAALLVLAVGAFDSPWLGLAYIFLFGVGSILGMGVLSLAIAAPLSLSAKFVGWVNKGLQTGIATLTVALGVVTAFENWPF